MPSSSTSRARTMWNTDDAADLPSSGAENIVEGGLHRLVQRRHPRGQSQRREYRSGWPCATANSAAAAHAPKNSVYEADEAANDVRTRPSPAARATGPRPITK